MKGDKLKLVKCNHEHLLIDINEGVGTCEKCKEEFKGGGLCANLLEKNEDLEGRLAKALQTVCDLARINLEFKDS